MVVGVLCPGKIKDHIILGTNLGQCLTLLDGPFAPPYACAHLWSVCLLLFYAMATVFHSYHGGDMMYEKRRR